jgi:hypothetical protein
LQLAAGPIQQEVQQEPLVRRLRLQQAEPKCRKNPRGSASTHAKSRRLGSQLGSGGNSTQL